MIACLDSSECSYQNLETARFCAHCGIPLQGTFLQGRYEIHALIGKDRHTVTLQALDRQSNLPVIIRALLPRKSTARERENFLQDAELALALSSNLHEPESIRVIDYGQDGPLAFLVKSENMPAHNHPRH